MLKKAGFIDPCLAIDIVDEERTKLSGSKLCLSDIENAAGNIFSAGYSPGEVSAYMIMGLPGQELKEVEEAVDYIHGQGLKVRLAEYAVVPGSRDSLKFSDEILSEPLLHNNSIFPSYSTDEWEEIHRIKNHARRLNNEF